MSEAQGISYGEDVSGALKPKQPCGCHSHCKKPQAESKTHSMDLLKKRQHTQDAWPVNPLCENCGRALRVSLRRDDFAGCHSLVYCFSLSLSARPSATKKGSNCNFIHQFIKNLASKQLVQFVNEWISPPKSSHVHELLIEISRVKKQWKLHPWPIFFKKMRGDRIPVPPPSHCPSIYLSLGNRRCR